MTPESTSKLHASGARTRARHSVGFPTILWCVAGLAIGLTSPRALFAQIATNQEPPAAPAAEENPTTHRIDRVAIRYIRDNPGHPDSDTVLDGTIRIVKIANGYAAASPDAAGVIEVRLRDIGTLDDPRFTDEALTLFAPAALVKLKGMGLIGVFVTPDAAQFRVEDGAVVDARASGDTTLMLEVTTGTVTHVRTVGVGERLPPDQTIDNELHNRIRERSPVQPHVEGQEVRSDLLRTDALDEYLYRLNRHPGRRVDVSVSAPGDQPGSVTLDYMVTENRPWLFFGQLSNSGSASTSAWREHFGFIHNDLTNNDDILTLDYQTANFEDVHHISGSYERPIGSSQLLRWRVYGGWYEYTAGEVGIQDAEFGGDGNYLGGEIIWNIAQRKDWFLDVIAGVRYERVHVSNELAAQEGEDSFFKPDVALRLFRERDDTRTDLRVGVSFNMPGVAGTDEDLDALGRLNASNAWTRLYTEGEHSFYLDPHFYSGNSERAGGLAHEVLIAFRGQTSFGERLIPNEQMVAGGLYTVRGYPHAIVAGDNVIMGTLEYRLHVPRLAKPEVQPGSFMGQPFRWQPQYAFGPTDWDVVLKAFIDAARVTNADRESYEFDSTLIGAGIGAEVAITRRFNVRADLGFALKELEDSAGESIVDAGHAELHFVLTLIY